MHHARKPMALAFGIGLLLVSVLSVFLMAEHAGHGCQREQCGVCAVLAQFSRALRQLGTALAAAALILAASCVCGIASVKAIPIRGTPVSLKVQLNN